MFATVRAASAATAILVALSAPARAAEEKSTKPRLAVLEFANKAEAQLEVDAVSWGEWIADVERPQETGKVSKVDAFTIKQNTIGANTAGRANDRLRNAGPKDGWPAAGRGRDIARVDGDIAKPSTAAGKRPKTRPMVLVPGGKAPRPAAKKGEKGGTEDINIGVGELQEGRGGVTVAAGDISGDGAASAHATGKRQHMPTRTRAYYDAPLERGSVMLRLAQPWAGCAVGDRFNGIYLTTGVSHRYQLEGAEIAACGGSTVTINYARFLVAGEPVR
jgi:hypothetical protein